MDIDNELDHSLPSSLPIVNDGHWRPSTKGGLNQGVPFGLLSQGKLQKAKQDNDAMHDIRNMEAA